MSVLNILSVSEGEGDAYQEIILYENLPPFIKFPALIIWELDRRSNINMPSLQILQNHFLYFILVYMYLKHLPRLKCIYRNKIYLWYAEFSIYFIYVCQLQHNYQLYLITIN